MQNLELEAETSNKYLFKYCFKFVKEAYGFIAK